MFVDSEIENSDDDDEEPEFEEEKRIRVGKQFLTPDEERFVEDCSGEEDCESELLLNESISERAGQVDPKWKWTAKPDVKWGNGKVKKPNFGYEPLYNDFVEEPCSPVDYFMRYIPDSLFDEMVTYTNLYAEQQHTKKWRPTDKMELKQFFGIQIMMGNLKLPRIEMFYGEYISTKFRDTIPEYRFYLLRTNFHLVNVLTIPPDSSDKFVRVRPLMDSVRNRCLQLPLEENLSIDEQMIPMRGRVGKGVKQYVRNKPKIKWGIKNIALCGKSGLAYDFVTYQGSTTEFDPDMLSKFGTGATMVLHLSSRIQHPGHKLFFDNYFSTFPLFQILAQKKIHAAGTVRLDRFSNPPFSKDPAMKKNGRGCSEEVVSHDGSVACVKWYDNKCVALASNYIGVGTTDKAQRFDKNTRQKISIDRPEIVREYNTYMGGVDLMNQMVSYYRIFIRSKKWTLRMVTHFIDFAVINSWIEYKNDCEKSGLPKRQVMDLLAFRMQLAKELVCPTAPKRTTRITLDEIRSKNVCTEGREHRTDHNIRYDRIDHLPGYSEQRMRCKLETCSLQSQIFCEKCNVHLCLNKNNTCFTKYHTST